MEIIPAMPVRRPLVIDDEGGWMVDEYGYITPADRRHVPEFVAPGERHWAVDHNREVFFETLREIF